MAQIHKRNLFKLGSLGNCVVDDIHSHWKSYLHKYGVLADAPCSQFLPREGWDTVYTWKSLEEHEPMLTNTYGKKVAKPSLMVVVAPTTTKIGDDYFLNKLHKSACIKRKSVYYGAKVSRKRSCMQVVICPYCRVLSQNAPSGCSHIWKHLGLTFACGGCRKFSVTSSLPYGGVRAPRHICLFQPRTGRQDLHAQQSRRQSLYSQQLVTLEMFILWIFPIYDSC